MNWNCKCSRCLVAREVLRALADQLFLAVVVVLAAVVLSGCTNTMKSDIDIALKLCEPNGGIVSMSVSLMGDRSHQVTATCVNGAVVSKNNKDV